MPIVSDGQLNLAALQVDDVYVVVVPPQTPLIPGVPTDGVGLVGGASKGKPNTVIGPIGDVSSLVRQLGQINSTDPFDVVTEAIGALKQGANNLYIIRVTDGTDVAAFGNAVDNSAPPTGANLLKFTAASSGIWANTAAGINTAPGTGMVVNIGVGSSSAATPATGTVTVTTVQTTGTTMTITLNSIAIGYVVKASDAGNTAGVAQALASLINGNSQAAQFAFASVAGSIITITAVTQGTVGNSITLVASTGMTASGATLATGAGTQTYKVVIKPSNDVPEVFDNIPGIAGTTGSTTGALLTTNSAVANIINAITNGISGQRGPSALVTAAVATSPGTGTLVNQQVQFSNGTDGRTGLNTNTMIGVDGFTRSGMYMLRGLPIAQFGLAGMTDPSSWTNQINFAVSEVLAVVLAQPTGISSLTAVNNMNINGVDAYQAVMVKDFLWLNDTFNGVIRSVSPIGATLGKMATLSPERSPANKPTYGYLGTERTGFVGPGGSFNPGIPYSTAEIGLLESNGITFFYQPSVGGRYLSLRDGQNTSSDPTRNGINYTKLTQFLAKSLNAALGFAVDEPQTPELRRRVRSAISQFLQSLADPGPGRNPMIGDVNGGPAYSVICDSTNNPSNLVDLGYMFVTCQVKYFAIVRFFVVQIEAGQSVTVQIAQNNPVITQPLAA